MNLWRVCFSSEGSTNLNEWDVYVVALHVEDAISLAVKFNDEADDGNADWITSVSLISWVVISEHEFDSEKEHDD